MSKDFIEAITIKTELANSRSNIGLVNLLVVLGYLDSVHEYRLIKKRELNNKMTTLTFRKKDNYYDETIPCDSSSYS